MEIIHLRQTLPQVFADRDAITSDVWHQDLVLRKGERYLIEAASGTGKSSLCSYIYGYRRDYQGIISFDERNIRSLSIHEWVELRKHSLSMLFQELRIFPELTALENVQLKNRLTNYKKKKEILALFETLGIAEKVNEKAGKLSFGQQQRVAFIRALCQPFDFIFLDEPISHLDDDNGKPKYQGGFIWDYIDQSIYKKDRYGEEFQAYGGDFGERPTDYNFSGNGIVYGGNRDVSPKMQEVKFNYQNITAEVTAESVTVKNKNLFVNTDRFACVVTVAKDGKEIRRADLPTAVEPL